LACKSFAFADWMLKVHIAIFINKSINSILETSLFDFLTLL
jgi:hypothetical protein